MPLCLGTLKLSEDFIKLRMIYQRWISINLFFVRKFMSQLLQNLMMTTVKIFSEFFKFQILPDFSTAMIRTNISLLQPIGVFVKWLETANLGITQLIKLQLIMTYWTAMS